MKENKNIKIIKYIISLLITNMATIYNIDYKIIPKILRSLAYDYDMTIKINETDL